MAYEYDVFLSYNRKYPHGEWVNETFFPLFESYLSDALNVRKAKIFKDDREIKNGADWAKKIRKGLVCSKAMVSIFSPAYFNSEWCMREFATLYHRQCTLGFLTDDAPDGLIVPMQLFDGQHFPKFGSRHQMLDCREYNRVGPGFKHTSQYIEFQEKLQFWVDDVAAAVNRAPAWDAAWLGKEWVEDAFDQLTLPMISDQTPPPTL